MSVVSLWQQSEIRGENSDKYIFIGFFHFHYILRLNKWILIWNDRKWRLPVICVHDMICLLYTCQCKMKNKVSHMILLCCYTYYHILCYATFSVHQNGTKKLSLIMLALPFNSIYLFHRFDLFYRNSFLVLYVVLLISAHCSYLKLQYMWMK